MKARLNKDNTAVVAERYSHALLKKDAYPSTIPALKIFTSGMWAEHNVFDVVENEPAYDPDTQKVVSTGIVAENGVPVRQYSVVSLTADELATKAEAAAKQAAIEAEIQADEDKLAGVLIEGVMCSATGKDQAGLSAVAVGAMRAQLSGGVFADTAFEFENGSKLTITAANFAAIEAIWTPFRQGFYAPTQGS